jgi:hypothetical protein
MPGDSIVTSLEEMAFTLRARYKTTHDGDGKRSWHIPPEHVFVVGDSVPRGMDSLTWGPVPMQHISGVVLLKLAPVLASADA